MLYLYENGLGQFSVVQDNGNGNTTTIGTYTTLGDAQTAFNSQILSQQQVTKMQWDGAIKTDYTTTPPTVTNT